jgi:hypothetical protein
MSKRDYLKSQGLDPDQSSPEPPNHLPERSSIGNSRQSSTLSELSSTYSFRSNKSGAMPSTSFHVPVYNDTISSDAKFWVEIHPMNPMEFRRDEYVFDEREINVVGIIGEVGEGDDVMYEVQFEDDHIAIVFAFFQRC